ncbi:MAG TPA: DUF4149 domain-containing protein [Gemmatimonadaceae bacterium]
MIRFEMPTAYLINVTVHVFAAIFWLGGIFFLGIVGAPVLRAVEPPSLRQRLFSEIGTRFRTAGWIAIAVLIATGLLNLRFRGWLRWNDVLGSDTFWATNTGHMLALKLATVTIMVGVGAVHDFALGPAASRAEAGSEHATHLRRRAAWLARINAMTGVILVIAAVRLTRG